MDPNESRPLIPWSFQDHLDFVKAFERYPALWDTRSVYYRKSDLVNKAYEALIAKFPLYLSTKTDVKKKMNSLRTGYKKDIKKGPVDSSGNLRKRSDWLHIADRFFKHWCVSAAPEHDDITKNDEVSSGNFCYIFYIFVKNLYMNFYSGIQRNSSENFNSFAARG